MGIITEDDDECHFGLASKYEPFRLPSKKIDTECLTHLDNAQRTELLLVLDHFPGCFSDKLGLCELVTHELGSRLSSNLGSSRQIGYPRFLKVKSIGNR